MVDIITIDIPKSFSNAPGARTRNEGDFSGQEFLEDILAPAFENNPNATIEIILDGALGYGTSFLEEAFGGLARKYSKENVLKRLNFISVDEPMLIDEIKGYINKV